jgi:hypothetical protein
MFYVYSQHRTLDAARAALDHFWATGEISEGEHARIMRRGKWHCVMLPEGWRS